MPPHPGELLAVLLTLWLPLLQSNMMLWIVALPHKGCIPMRAPPDIRRRRLLAPDATATSYEKPSMFPHCPSWASKGLRGRGWGGLRQHNATILSVPWLVNLHAATFSVNEGFCHSILSGVPVSTVLRLCRKSHPTSAVGNQKCSICYRVHPAQ